jgi:hypothetical protein
MFGFLKRSDVKASSDRSKKSLAGSLPSMPAENTKRELIPMVLKFVLKQAGIPFGWISFGEIFHSSKNGQPSACVQLVINHLDDRLVCYLSVLQTEFLRGLDLFEPKVDHKDYSVAWTVADSENSEEKLPPPKYWLPQTKSASPVSRDSGPISHKEPAKVEVKPRLAQREYLSQAFADTDLVV